jgi:hypothetical protein
MSLINEALKKAQRLRAEQQGMPPMPGGTSPGIVVKRGQAMPAQTLVLILAAAVVLIVLSAVLTGYFLNRTPAPTHAQEHKAARTAVAPDPAAPSPVIVAPVITMPKPAAAEPTPPATIPAAGTAGGDTAPTRVAPADRRPAPAAASSSPRQPEPVAKPTPVPAASATSLTGENKPRETPPPATAAPAPPKADPRVQVFVDSVRVAGIRFSGDDSKVLMNDRVYRVNDVVDFPLNVRLQKVAPDSLTFVDANGVTYVKNF